MTWHRRFAHTSAKRCDYAGGLAERSAAEKPDYRHRSLLRARRKRPRHRGAAEQYNELAPFQLTELHPLSPGGKPDTGYRIARIKSGARCNARCHPRLCRFRVKSTHYRAAALLSASPQLTDLDPSVADWFREEGLSEPKLGWEDSNSGIRARAMYLRCRDNSRRLGQNSPPETIRV
jgi:hypothetical protein